MADSECESLYRSSSMVSLAESGTETRPANKRPNSPWIHSGLPSPRMLPSGRGIPPIEKHAANALAYPLSPRNCGLPSPSPFCRGRRRPKARMRRRRLSGR
jgi:hypothetical protein